ncbi:MAG: 1-acyl-sn-glycerol-3-phosphate acyltransferase, partial [SAR324 cluster bacterium]|nr:1-acyl-sn-glycerol-3-phosphate acyltransferase [SAR324 cluster bacterium]
MDLYSYSRFINPLVKRYARLNIEGKENLPEPGKPFLIACNHSGGMWWDALCLVTSMPERQLHFIAHHWDGTIKPMRVMLESVGSYFLAPTLDEINENDPVVVGLKQGKAMCQFPEESYHTFRNRYTLYQFSGQVIKYSHLANTPIIPTAVIGAEEAAPTFWGPKIKGIPWHIPMHPPIYLPLPITI